MKSNITMTITNNYDHIEARIVVIAFTFQLSIFIHVKFRLATAINNFTWPKIAVKK